MRKSAIRQTLQVTTVRYTSPEAHRLPGQRQLIAAGRITSVCSGCRGFGSVKVRASGGGLRTVHCPECVQSPTFTVGDMESPAGSSGDIKFAVYAVSAPFASDHAQGR